MRYTNFPPYHFWENLHQAMSVETRLYHCFFCQRNERLSLVDADPRWDWFSDGRDRFCICHRCLLDRKKAKQFAALRNAPMEKKGPPPPVGTAKGTEEDA